MLLQAPREQHFGTPIPVSAQGIGVVPNRRQHKNRCRFMVALLLALMSVPAIGHTAPLSKHALAALAQRCAPNVDTTVLRAVAATESHFDPLALRNNTKHQLVWPASAADAIQQANQWIAKGDSVDLGLMQINSGNFAKVGLTVDAAFEPCRSLEASAHILSAAYHQGASTVDRQAALLIALSRYNTGRSLAGLANGYVGQVLAAQDGTDRLHSTAPTRARIQPSSWDVWAIASAARQDGAAWLIGSQATQDFIIGAGAHSTTGELHAMSQGPRTALGM